MRFDQRVPSWHTAIEWNSPHATVETLGRLTWFTVGGSGFQVEGFGLRGLGFGVEGLGFRVWGLGFRVWGLGLRV